MSVNRLQAIATPLVANMDKVQIIPPPKGVDPRVLVWKGAAVLGKMDGVSDLWVTASDWVSLSKVFSTPALILEFRTSWGYAGFGNDASTYNFASLRTNRRVLETILVHYIDYPPEVEVD